jgi:hypothetical protein
MLSVVTLGADLNRLQELEVFVKKGEEISDETRLNIVLNGLNKLCSLN